VLFEAHRENCRRHTRIQKTFKTGRGLEVVTQWREHTLEAAWRDDTNRMWNKEFQNNILRCIERGGPISKPKSVLASEIRASFEILKFSQVIKPTHPWRWGQCVPSKLPIIHWNSVISQTKGFLSRCIFITVHVL